jgi:hypothetical protein
MAIKQLSVRSIGDAVFVEFWDTNSQNVEQNHSLIMAMIEALNE